MSRQLGVPTPTIRSWERRHGLLEVSRTAGGHRRYSREQVELLRRLRDLVAQGHRPADAVTQIWSSGQDTTPESLVQAILDAARDLESDRIGEVLDSAERALGLGRTVDEVLLPALRAVGEWWQGEQEDVLHEHLATQATQAWLARMPGESSAPPAGGPLILCCGPRDHHTLALEAMAALLRQRGWDCRVLGARTPGTALVQAVDETSALAVILVSHIAAARSAAVEALQLAAATRARVFYAGGAFASAQARSRVPGHYLGTHLTSAADFITAALQQAADADQRD